MLMPQNIQSKLNLRQSHLSNNGWRNQKETRSLIGSWAQSKNSNSNSAGKPIKSPPHRMTLIAVYRTFIPRKCQMFQRNKCL